MKHTKRSVLIAISGQLCGAGLAMTLIGLMFAVTSGGKAGMWLEYAGLALVVLAGLPLRIGLNTKDDQQ